MPSTTLRPVTLFNSIQCQLLHHAQSHHLIQCQLLHHVQLHCLIQFQLLHHVQLHCLIQFQLLHHVQLHYLIQFNASCYTMLSHIILLSTNFNHSAIRKKQLMQVLIREQMKKLSLMTYLQWMVKRRDIWCRSTLHYG